MSIAEDAPRNTAQMPHEVSTRTFPISEEEMAHRRVKVGQIDEKYKADMMRAAGWILFNFGYYRDTEDVVQQTIVGMLERHSVAFPTDELHERNWVLKSVRRQALDHVIKEKRRFAIPLDPINPTSDIPDHRFRSAEDEAFARMRYAQEYASPERRMIIEGATRKQRADHFGVTEGKIVAFDQKWERDHR